jgi:hypothetical protein
MRILILALLCFLLPLQTVLAQTESAKQKELEDWLRLQNPGFSPRKSKPASAKPQIQAPANTANTTSTFIIQAPPAPYRRPTEFIVPTVERGSWLGNGFLTPGYTPLLGGFGFSPWRSYAYGGFLPGLPVYRSFGMPAFGGFGGFGVFNGFGGFGGFGNPFGMGTRLTTNRVFQSEPSKASGNYYQPSTVDPTASGSYYASSGPTVIQASPAEPLPKDYWGPSGNPFDN